MHLCLVPLFLTASRCALSLFVSLVVLCLCPSSHLSPPPTRAHSRSLRRGLSNAKKGSRKSARLLISPHPQRQHQHQHQRRCSLRLRPPTAQNVSLDMPRHYLYLVFDLGGVCHLYVPVRPVIDAYCSVVADAREHKHECEQRKQDERKSGGYELLQAAAICCDDRGELRPASQNSE